MNRYWPKPSMSFEILSAQQDEARWSALIGELPGHLQDIHFLPQYGRIYRETHGFESLLAVWREADAFVLQPFVRRPLAGLPFLAEAPDRDRFFDIANAYGFGGALCNAIEPELAQTAYRNFREAFCEWGRSTGVASEFTCLHPVLETQQRAMMGSVMPSSYEKDVVVIDLSGSEAEMRSRLRKGHRSGITAAERHGVRVVRCDASGEALALFYELYLETMKRRQAEERWFLPAAYFARTASELGEGRTSLLISYVEGEAVSACFLMHDFETAYYHFAGTRAAEGSLGINNHLVWQAALWSKERGFRRLHLGGGVTRNPDDTLLRFKSGFSDCRLPLYTYFSVHDEVTYRELCDRKRAYERSILGAEVDSDFFPLYRRKDGL